jgi:hypothetical protein
MEENSTLNEKGTVDENSILNEDITMKENSIFSENITEGEYVAISENVDEGEYITVDEHSAVNEPGIFDEKKQMTDLVKSFKDILRFTNSFKEIKSDKIDALERLEKAVKGIPPSIDTFIIALEENRSNAKKFIEKAKAIRSESFKRHEAEYIKSLNSESKPVREYSNGWRTGKLMIKVRPGLSKIKILYNEQVLINWTSVNSKEDFIDLENRANDMLSAQVIPEQDIIDVFFEAFKQAKNHLSGKANSYLVPVLDFYKEVRIALIRKLLENKGSAAKIDRYHKFPLWAFLYNLDIYRSLGSKVPDNKRLGLQTGSMQEASQNKGLVVNGLNPNDEYKVMCYVIAIQRGSGR